MCRLTFYFFVFQFQKSYINIIKSRGWNYNYFPLYIRYFKVLLIEIWILVAHIVLVIIVLFFYALKLNKN